MRSVLQEQKAKIHYFRWRGGTGGDQGRVLRLSTMGIDRASWRESVIEAWMQSDVPGSGGSSSGITTCGRDFYDR
jgi:hypothetical protein